MLPIQFVARVLTRTFVTSQALPLTQHNELHLVAASSGLSKSVTRAQLFAQPTFNKGNSSPGVEKSRDPPVSFGDDACFIAKGNSSDVIGVADGVGGWRTHGVDPGKFATKLIHNCSVLASMKPVNGSLSNKRSVDFSAHPSLLLKQAFDELLEDKQNHFGSSTACILSLCRGTGLLSAANLGDSGFVVVRDGSVLHHSSEQVHHFNTPYQLSNAPTDMEAISDCPTSARTESLEVQHGDVVVLATDGLFDNLDHSMILQEISKLKWPSNSCPSLENIQRTANALTWKARKVSFDPEYLSPFAVSARKSGYRGVTGGKPDDVTVILACVCNNPSDS